MDTNAWLDVMMLDFQGLISTIQDLPATLPQVNDTPAPSKEFQIKRNLPLVILQGVFHTSWVGSTIVDLPTCMISSRRY